MLLLTGPPERSGARCGAGCWPPADPSGASSAIRGGSAPIACACRSPSATSAIRPRPPRARGVDTVIHLAAAIRDQPRGSIEELSGFATWRLLAGRRAGRRRALLVLLDARRRHPRAARAVHARQGVAEGAVVERALAWTVFAPSFIYAPDDPYLTLLAAVRCCR